MTSILQLSDLHLCADNSAQLKGINPWQSLQRVLQAVQKSGIPVDHVILSGDLAHDGLPQTYQHLAEALETWRDRLWAIPGNHDDRAQVERDSFRSQRTQGRCTFSFAAGTWQVIGLDTLVPGELRGEIGERQLAWLAAKLGEHRRAPTLIFLHHPPVDVGSAWLDRIGLVDRDEFRRLIEASPQVKLICCGHIHQEFEAPLGTATVLAAPSTSVQFQPGTETLVVDDLPPGFRIIRLQEETFSTQIIRAGR